LVQFCSHPPLFSAHSFISENDMNQKGMYTITA